MRVVRGIALDLEGTAVDVETVHFETFIRTARDLGLELTFFEILEKVPNALGGGDRHIAESFTRLIPGSTAADILGRKNAYYYELIRNTEIRPRSGVETAIEIFRDMGKSIALGSLTPREKALHLLECSGLVHLLDPHLFVFGEDVRRIKPAPDVYLRTAALMSIEPYEQLVFEDTAVGLRAARDAGSRAIGIPVFQLRDTLATLGDAGATDVFPD